MPLVTVIVINIELADAFTMTEVNNDAQSLARKIAEDPRVKSAEYVGILKKQNIE